MVVDSNLKSLLESFKHEDGVKTRIIKVEKPKKVTRRKVSKDYDGCQDLPPSLAKNLTVLFIGFNPGVESSKVQHHYAHFSNLFWKLFNQAKILGTIIEKDKIEQDELVVKLLKNGAKPEHDYELAKYNIGFTDLVLRCTKSAQELTMDEKIANVPRLIEELNYSNAKFIVFIGKGIWEIIVKYLTKQVGIKFVLTTKIFKWGLQYSVEDSAYQEILKTLYTSLPSNSRVYVFPNTSGLVTSMNFNQKLQLWQTLADDITEN